MTSRIELTLDAIATGGDSVGSNPHNGKVVFVDDAIPGERVEVEIVEETEHWERGRLVRVLDSSPDRVAAPCPYFGPPQPIELPDGSILNADGEPRCAGCLWQHIDYERQLSLKRAILVEQLARGADLDSDADATRRRADALVEEVIAVGAPAIEDEVVEDVAADGEPETGQGTVLDYNYLTQMTFALNQEGRLCLPAREGHGSILSIKDCLLHYEQLADLFHAFAVDEETGHELAQDIVGVEMSVGGTARAIGEGDEGMVVLQGDVADPPSMELDLPVNVLYQRPQSSGAIATELLVGEWSYPVSVRGERYAAYPPMGGSPMVWPHLLGDEVIGSILIELLDVKVFDHVLHLYAGAGLTSIILAERAATLIAAEDEELAVAALQSNTAGLDNVDIHRAPMDRILKQVRLQGYEVTVALLTPWNQLPDEEIARQLDLLALSRLGIVLDDGDDLAHFTTMIQAVDYDLTAVQPVDLQPQQETVTAIARFDRRR